MQEQKVEASEPDVGSNERSRRDVIRKGAAAVAGLAAWQLVKPGQVSAQAGQKVPKWGMVIDLRRCIGCRACTVACKTEFQVPLGVFGAVVKQKDSGSYPNASRSFLPLLCNHCGARDKVPPCIPVCPSDEREETYVAPDGTEIKYTYKASHKKPDGTVHSDAELCIGCERCVEACPYGVRYMDPSRNSKVLESNNVAAKCTFCEHRITQGTAPSCVNTCLGRARIFGDLNDPESEVSKLLEENETKVLLPDEGTEPNVYYIGLDDDLYEKGVEFRDHV